MRHGICWVLGIVIIVAGFGGYDFKFSNVNSASVPDKNSIEQLNTIQPFVIVGEGIDNIIHIEPIPGGKLLAQTPLSYRLVDPQTGKMERLPEGFPEGEITQWEDDYAVVRTIANQTKPVTYFYTIWPTMIRCVTHKRLICFTNKNGAYAALDEEKDYVTGVVFRCFNETGQKIWDEFIYTDEGKTHYFSFVRLFDDKIAVAESSGKIWIYNLSDGSLIKEGKLIFHTADRTTRGYYYQKPIICGNVLLLDNQSTISGANFDKDNNIYSITNKNTIESVLVESETIRHKIYDPKGNITNECLVDTTLIPHWRNILEIKNGVIATFTIKGDFFFVDLNSGKELASFHNDISHYYHSFTQDNNIIVLVGLTLYVFDTIKQKLTNRITIPWRAGMMGLETAGKAKLTTDSSTYFEVFEISNPEKKTLVKNASTLNTCVSKDGIISYKDWVGANEPIAIMNGFDGTMKHLGYASINASIYLIKEANNRIYGLFGYVSNDFKRSSVFLSEYKDNDWKRLLSLSDESYFKIKPIFSGSKVLFYLFGKMQLIDLDKQKLCTYSYPEEYNFYSDSTNYYLIDNYILVLGNYDNEYCCIITDLTTGKNHYFDKYLCHTNNAVYVKIDEQFYRFENGKIFQEDTNKYITGQFSSHTMSFAGLQNLYQSGNEIAAWESAKRDIVYKVISHDQGEVLSIPLSDMWVSSLPLELFPILHYTGNAYEITDDSWLPKMKNTGSFSFISYKSGTDKMECVLTAKDADIDGVAWLAELDVTYDVAFLKDPKQFKVSKDSAIKLDFNVTGSAKGSHFAFVVCSNGFLNSFDSPLQKKSEEIPLYLGMQSGPSGEEIASSIIWQFEREDQ